jgi:hypothetical protein
MAPEIQVKKSPLIGGLLGRWMFEVALHAGMRFWTSTAKGKIY